MIHTGNRNTRVHFWRVISLHIQQIAIQLQQVVCDTQVRVGVMFGKDIQLMWLSARLPKRLVYGNQLTIPLVLQKEIGIPPSRTSEVILQPSYTPT